MESIRDPSVRRGLEQPWPAALEEG